MGEGVRVGGKPQAVPCPVCGELIPVDQFDGHVKGHVAIERGPHPFAQVGTCIMAVYGKLTVYAKVIGADPLNPWRVYGVDTLGRRVMLDLRHAFIVTAISEEEFAEAERRARKRRARRGRQGQGSEVNNGA